MRARNVNRGMEDERPLNLPLTERRPSTVRNFVEGERFTRAVAEPNARHGFEVLEFVNLICTAVYVAGVVLNFSRVLEPAISTLLTLEFGFYLPFGFSSQATWLLWNLLQITIYPIAKILFSVHIMVMPLCQLAMSLSYAFEGMSDEIATIYKDRVLLNFWHSNEHLRKARIIFGVTISLAIFAVRYILITAVYGFCESILYCCCYWHLAAAALGISCEVLLVLKTAADELFEVTANPLSELKQQWAGSFVVPELLLIVDLAFDTFRLLLTVTCQFLLIIVGWPFCRLPLFLLRWIMWALTKTAHYSGMLKLSYWQHPAQTSTNSHLLTCVYTPVEYWLTNASLLDTRLTSHYADLNTGLSAIFTRYGVIFRLFWAGLGKLSRLVAAKNISSMSVPELVKRYTSFKVNKASTAQGGGPSTPQVKDPIPSLNVAKEFDHNEEITTTNTGPFSAAFSTKLWRPPSFGSFYGMVRDSILTNVSGSSRLSSPDCGVFTSAGLNSLHNHTASSSSSTSAGGVQFHLRGSSKSERARRATGRGSRARASNRASQPAATPSSASFPVVGQTTATAGSGTQGTGAGTSRFWFSEDPAKTPSTSTVQSSSVPLFPYNGSLPSFQPAPTQPASSAASTGKPEFLFHGQSAAVSMSQFGKENFSNPANAFEFSIGSFKTSKPTLASARTTAATSGNRTFDSDAMAKFNCVSQAFAGLSFGQQAGLGSSASAPVFSTVPSMPAPAANAPPQHVPPVPNLGAGLSGGLERLGTFTIGKSDAARTRVSARKVSPGKKKTPSKDAQRTAAAANNHADSSSNNIAGPDAPPTWWTEAQAASQARQRQNGDVPDAVPSAFTIPGNLLSDSGSDESWDWEDVYEIEEEDGDG